MQQGNHTTKLPAVQPGTLTTQERVSKTALKKRRDRNNLVLMLYKLHRLGAS